MLVDRVDVVRWSVGFLAFGALALTTACDGEVSSPDPSRGSASAGAGGDTREASNGTCTPNVGGAPSQTVTFHLTNTGTTSRWIVLEGPNCSVLELTRAGTILPQMPGHKAEPYMCNGWDFGYAPGFRTFAELAPGESVDVPWLAQELVACEETVACGDGNVLKGWKSAPQGVTAGQLHAKFGVVSTLPSYECSELSGGKLRCGGPSVGSALSPFVGFCRDADAVDVDFELPASGDATVAVAVP
jgi:hypothetical protein